MVRFSFVMFCNPIAVGENSTLLIPLLALTMTLTRRGSVHLWTTKVVDAELPVHVIPVQFPSGSHSGYVSEAVSRLRHGS